MTPKSDTVTATGYKWREIEDLPSDWRELCRDDLRVAHRQWMGARNRAQVKAELRKIEDELAMRWAVETGVIERLYWVEPRITVQIAQGGLPALDRLHSQGDISLEARALITDQREALEMAKDFVVGTRPLSPSFMKELHHRLTLSQQYCEAVDRFGRLVKTRLLKGAWKARPNNPRRPDGLVHEYCPPERVQDQIEQLLRWHREHRQVSPEVEAAWLHHRFVQIHPF